MQWWFVAVGKRIQCVLHIQILFKSEAKHALNKDWWFPVGSERIWLAVYMSVLLNEATKGPCTFKSSSKG